MPNADASVYKPLPKRTINSADLLPSGVIVDLLAYSVIKHSPREQYKPVLTGLKFVLI
jgi:hypothetical protein